MHQNDEEILYDSYLKLGKRLCQKNEDKKNRVDALNDKSLVSGITASSSLMITRLTDDEMQLSTLEIQKYVISAKGMYLQYASIKGRNPGCLSSSLEKNMDRMIRAVCKHEADMIEMLRLQETGGERIDIQGIFDQRKNLNRLGSTIAVTIVSDAIIDTDYPIGFIPEFYITDTGRRFHRADCPYCRGRQLTVTTLKMIENQKLTPCKCLSTLPTKDDTDHTCVTAFIDESIHPVLWDEKGKKGKTGSYSYIICWGNLTDESQITDKRLITQGVDFIGEHEHIERITESAVGKVLMTMAYDYEFTGQVQIYTDNQSVADYWLNSGRNSRLARLFLSVEVSFIPREFNRRADKLGRTRMLLDMPISAYNEAVKNKTRINELENKVALLEAEKTADIVIPEVIVANKVSYPPIPKRKILFFDNLIRYIRNRFEETFSRKAVSNP